MQSIFSPCIVRHDTAFNHIYSNSIMKCACVIIRNIYLFSFRVLNLDQIGKSVSGDIHAKSHDASADRHALLWPLEFKGQIVRRLNDWCTAIPAVSVSCKIESVKVPTQHAYTGVRVVTETV